MKLRLPRLLTPRLPPCDGQVRMTNDIALPDAGGFGGRAQLIEGLTDGANLLGQVFRRLRP